GAAVYTSFAVNAGVNVKPINGSTQNSYANTDRAGTPENYKSFVVDGARGAGLTNYTGSFSTATTATCAAPGQRSSLPLVITQPLSGDSLLKDKLNIDVLPNPSNTYFNLVIKGNSNNPVQVRVTNIFGQVMEKHEKIASNATLRLGQRLPGGTYFVEIIQDGHRRIMKIIKTN
ncbi:MAG: T9SS type A sorting domain-containing protein, partial [Chitinophagaceae bacterium]